MNTDPAALAPDKGEIRDAAMRLRAQLINGVEAAEALSGHVRTLLAARTGAESEKPVVGGYWPIGTEIDVRPLMRDLERAGHRLCLPTVAKPDSPLVFRAWGAGDELVDGPHGTFEPGPEAPEIRPDVMLVPLLAFDADAFRIGYGKGYYDRTISALRRDGSVIAIGTAFAAQVVDQVPREAHDAALDLVATEQGIFVPGEVKREVKKDDI